MVAFITLILVAATAALGYYNASPVMIPVMGLMYTPVYIYRKKVAFARYATKGPFSLLMGVVAAVINECLIAALIFYVAMLISRTL